ncbi:helix-turn-helix domain-containing protein [Sinorhizobium meliloti]|nr:helix-turn-helix domain-containing protein [Sinorhizobium meliloti]MDW9440917.1 helix-turn-helix domain-containing protein [Sinorhizobium meliloti]MDW9454981.1 helix-turn-helix domain-containing protein [Sinorhizobium meliloti]MDW9467143.1 helix-turn-helix domain-containing protein [Sinorhizobium meliloti]MDW9519152.1 helix-turn-helix domain-containing protein [Sinorhizobium meliloti]
MDFERKTPAEQIAALIAAGWQRIEIGERCGMGRDTVRRILAGREPTPHEARRIEKLYREVARPRTVAGPPLRGKLGHPYF